MAQFGLSFGLGGRTALSFGFRLRPNRTAPPRLAWATNRSDLPISTAAVSATLIYAISRVSFWTGARPIKNPRFGWVNWFLEATQGAESTTGLTPFTLQKTSLHWAGQSALVNSDNALLNAGDTFDGAAFNCTIPANTQFWVTTVATLQASGTRPVQYYFHSSRGEGATYASTQGAVDNQFTGTLTLNDTQNGIGPAYGYGEVVGAAIPSVTITGDSIGSYGLNDNAGADAVGGARTGGDSAFNRGYLRRAIHGLKGYPVLGLGRSGAKIEGGYGAGFARRQAILTKASTHVISQLGQNNVSDGEATLKTKIDALLAAYAAFSLPLVQCGLCPASTSTDAFATLANQTPASVALRDNMAAYYQAKVGSTLHSVLTPMDFLSPVGGDHGKWSPIASVAATADGIHPNANAAAAAATGIAAQITF